MDDLDLAIDNAVPTSVQARRATVAAEPQDQDAAAKAYEIAPKVGLPPSIVQYNANAFEQDLKRSVDGAVLDGNPKLQQFIIDDPTRAVAAKGGYQELDKISKIADPMPNLELQTDYGFQSLPEELPGKSAYEGLARGWQERQFGTLAYRQMMGEEGLEPALQSYEKQMGTQDEYKGFDYLVNSLAGLVGNLGASAAVSAPAVGGGAAVGAAAGGPAGAVAGAGAGLTAGVLADQFKTQAGSFFRDSGKILDRNGNPLPVEIRKTMALGVASVNTALMGAAPAAAHAGISAIMSEAALRAIAEPGVLQALYRGLTKAGLGSLEFGAINTGMEASQIAATEIGKAVSGQNFDTVLNDPAQREAAVQRVSQGLINGLTLGTVLPFTPLGTNYLRDRIAVAQSGFEARQRELMHDAVQNSEVFKKSPTLVADWLRVHEGLEDVMVPAEEVAKRREEFGYVPDLDAQLETQLPLGGDVKIPAADYYTKTPEETGKALNDVIRGPSGVTVEEAKDLQENPPDYPTVYHGSPHSFEAFDIGKIGTGEGVQAYGHGLYFAERRGIAEDYQRSLSENNRTINGEPVDSTNPLHAAVTTLENAGDIEEAIGAAKDYIKYAKEGLQFAPQARGSVEEMTNQSVKFYEKVLQHLEDDKTGKAELPLSEATGHLYQAKIMRPKEHFLDYDAPFEEQSAYVQAGLKKVFGGKTPDEYMASIAKKEEGPFAGVEFAPMTGADIHDKVGQAIAGPEGGYVGKDRVAKELADAGIAGIKYRDASSRGDRGMIDLWQKAVDEAIEGLKEAEAQGDDVGATTERQALAHAQKKLTEEKEAYENPTRNYVVFNDKDVLITHKNDVARQIEEALERTTEQIMAGMNLQPTGKPNFLKEKAASKDNWLEPETGVRGGWSIENERNRETRYFDTEEEARAAQTALNKSNEGKPNFLSSTMEKEATGLPKRPFEQLAQRVQEVQREITQKAYDAAYRELIRREKPLYKNELALETARAREDLEKRPDILAYQAMVNLPKDNEFSIKLDRNEVDGLYNRESPADYAAFQKGTRASESFPNKMFAKDGIHPDEAASLVGFSSGKEMLDQLRSYESAIRDSGLSERKYLDGLVKAEGERRMAEKDNLNERVSAEALDLALSVKQVDVLIAEMHALVPGEETKLTRGAVEEAAERNFGQLNSKKVKSADFERQVAKWGREAFRFSNADKPVEALKALQKQLSNFLMAREAKAFEKERDRAEKIMGRFQANRSLENVTQEYTDYAHSILARMDRPIPVDIRDLEDRLANKSFLQFVSDERNKGLDIADTSWLHDPTGLPRLDDLNVEQYRQLADTFESLYNKGKEQKVIEIGDKQLERDIVKERLIRYLKGMIYDRGRVIDGKATGAWNNLKWVGREIDAIAKEPQYIVKRIDNDDPLGPWTQDIYRPIYDRLNQRDDRLRDVAERFAELYDDEWARASENLVTNSFRDLNGKPMQITNAQKLVMLLNSGNDRNMRLLAHTLSEDVDTVREWLKQNVTEKDLKIAHGVLDLFENLWPDLKDMTRRVSGVSPAKVRARGYDTPVGRFEGGYFPSLADPDMVDLKGESDLFDRRWFDPATDSRAAHERTGALYPLSFDLNRLPYVVRQTVHDIYMREPVSNAWSFMNDREIKSAFTDAWGPEYTKQLKPWLSHVANDGGVPTFDGLWTPYKWSREARRNAVAVLVGGRPSTALIHGGSALAQSVTEVGLRPFVKEAWNVMTRSEEAGTTAWNNSMGLSSALRNRMHNIYTSLESEVPHILNQSNARQEYLAFSTRLIAALDQWSAVVVFRARMKQALDAGMSTDEAIWTANRSVDIAHGSNTLVNRPAVMRGGEGSKWFTQFMGFFNNTYNRGRDIGVKVSQGKYMEAMIGTLGFLAASAAVHTAVRYNQKDPVWKQALESGADVTVGGIPIVRDAFRGMIHGGDYGESMMTTMTKGITQPVAEWGKFATGGKAPKDWVSHLLMAPGFGMGFLPGVTGAGPKFLTGHAGDWLTLATTKTGSGHAQYLWDSLYRHSLEPPDIRRGILEGNWHQRKAGH